MARSRTDAGIVYFLQEGRRGPIKIGITSEHGYVWRLGRIRTGNPRRLRLVGMVPGEMCVERQWHSRFAVDRIRNEWFRPSMALALAIIAARSPKFEYEGDPVAREEAPIDLDELRQARP